MVVLEIIGWGLLYFLAAVAVWMLPVWVAGIILVSLELGRIARAAFARMVRRGAGRG